MNRLSTEYRARILHLLCEGMSIRAVSRLTGASKNTVTKLLINAGKACAAYHDANVRAVPAKRVQVYEIWSFNSAKQENVPTVKAVGDAWTWTAIDADSKLIVSYLVGGRDADYAMWCMEDLASRLASRVQLTSDGPKAYLQTVEGAYGCDVDYAQLVKMYGPTITAPGRYVPAECTGAKKVPIMGSPDYADVSTSYVERQNLTMSMHMRRFTRLTNAFSKKVENHAHAVALHMMYYNFVRIHKTLRVTPAMAADVTNRLWDIADIAKLVEDAEAKPGKRRPYKKISN
ncbi:IS1 family transposase [Polymorphobacter sp.]|uniref:IS1 family transposase n=1 Tax=Polymorphobacter sp. TaxID=1909290 RepID=UPI003F6F1C48